MSAAFESDARAVGLGELAGFGEAVEPDVIPQPVRTRAVNVSDRKALINPAPW
jgi:hypothetical protein